MYDCYTLLFVQVALSFLFQLIYGVSAPSLRCGANFDSRCVQILIVDTRTALSPDSAAAFDNRGGSHPVITQFMQCVGPVLFSLHCGVALHVRSQWYAPVSLGSTAKKV